MAEELNVTQTCPKCGDAQEVSPSYAEYINRYGCYECRQRDIERADRESPIREAQ
jgi:hypothetical protein